MLKISLHLFLIFNYFLYGRTENYNPYDNKQEHHLIQQTNSANEGYYYNAQQAAFKENTFYQQNQQGNSNYPQLYYYTTPYQQQRQPLQPQQTTQLWSGPPIVVEDDIQQQQQSSTNIPPTFYQQHSTDSLRSRSGLLPFLNRNSKVLTPTVYSPQPTTRTSQAYFNNNNNNNNIIYHRDFRHQINAIPEIQHSEQEDNMVSWSNEQQQLEQQQLQQQNQPQQFYSSVETNSGYNGISNDLLVASFGKVNTPDYREHFKHYLENNPSRIKPIY